MLKAILFDMGGTLLRYQQPDSQSWRELETPGIRGVYRYLIDQGHPIASVEDEFVEVMFSRLVEGWKQSTGGTSSMRAYDLINTLARDNDLALDQPALTEAVLHYARPMREGVRTAPGAAETLERLRGRGLRTGLISNTIWPGEFHLEDLAEAQLLQYLEHTIFSGDLGIWKPNPEIFQHALAKLDVQPSEAIFVGDNPREDILGAQAASIRTVWVANREFPLGDVTPDATINQIPELLALVERWADR